MNTTELEKAKNQSLDQCATASNWRRPRYNVAENDEAFNIQVSMPGVPKGCVDISVDGDILNIIGSRANSQPDGWRPLRRELPDGDYRLNLRLNVAINEEKIKARVEDGVLNLTLPKADEVKPRKIKIA